MADENRTWRRQDKSFWRAHHEAWKRSDLNQRQYCEAEGIPLKAFGNWRTKFKAEPRPLERKLLYRRRGLSHSLSHTLSPGPSHVTYPSSRPEGPIVPRPREGHRRRFGEADKRPFLEEAVRPGTGVSDVARRYGIDRRILCRKLSPPAFVAVEITDVAVGVERRAS
jgi:hypothetical protein